AIDRLVDDVMRGSVSRRSLLKRAAALGLAAPTISVLIAACGDDDDPTATPEPAATTPPSAGDEPTATAEPADDEPEPTEEPSQGSDAPSGQIVIMQGVDANTLDPLFRNATPEFTINAHVFDMMLNRN